ncbi:MAG TPA: MBL fold metallo-hydrolase [Xanthobacteraceae bacterium]|nr:MBL fold metallo-hydrolase [Xanthobacteraceae bacterium]
MRLQFIGCGDAFGSGGRFNTCFHVTGHTANFLIDFGATSLVALKQLGIDHNAIDIILVTHFHGDHFGGIPFLILDAALVSKRARPLTIAGPPGLSERYARAMDVAFPSFPHRPDRFPLALIEIAIGQPTEIGDLKATALPVVHAEAAGPCVGYRIEVEGRVLAYSGDTQWTESLIEIGRDADLFICEAYSWKRQVKSHTDYATLEQNVHRIAPKRLVLTHMSEDMLAHVQEAAHPAASDGMVIEF